MNQVLTFNLAIEDLRLLIDDIVSKAVERALNKVKQANEQPVEQDLLSIKEAAAFLRVSLPTLYKLRREGQIKAKKLGTVIRFDKNELQAALNNNTKEPKKREGLR